MIHSWVENFDIDYQAKDSQTLFHPMDQEKLAREMKEDGMSFRWSVWDKSGSEKKPYEAVSEPENRELKVKVSLNSILYQVMFMQRIILPIKKIIVSYTKRFISDGVQILTDHINFEKAL